MTEDVNSWLKQNPKDDEVEIINGINLIRQKVVEQLLDDMTGQNWSTRDYNSKYVTINGELHISASLVLIVCYKSGEDMITRSVVGAVSFPISFFGNCHIDNTAKSLCIVNAASELGNRLGRNLNQSVLPVIEGKKLKRSSVLITPDIKILKQYNDALLSNDTKTIEKLSSIYKFKPDVDAS